MTWDFGFLIPLLALVTLLLVAIFALSSKAKTEKRRHDSDAPKSTLAVDAPSERAGDPPDWDAKH